MIEQKCPTKRFLVTPLDWGLGHATRCIPVIRTLVNCGQHVKIGATGAGATLLSQEFPDLEVLPMPGYHMRYASHPLLLSLKFPFMVAKVLFCAYREHWYLERLLKKHRIDAVISDQRFGCHSDKVVSIYISHQLCVKMPMGFGLLERAVSFGLRHAAEYYDVLWIPDFPGEDNLTGDLSRKYPLHGDHLYVGPLSRFGGGLDPVEEDIDLLAMLSGPEPQRTMFQKSILFQLSSFTGKAVVVLGKPGGGIPATPRENVEIYAHLEGQKLADLIRRSKAVVCRGGYTTIMELIVMGKKAVLVPTPGQTEQEYLCDRLAKQQRGIVMKQKNLHINSALRQLRETLPPPPAAHPPSLLRSAVEDAIARIDTRE